MLFDLFIQYLYNINGKKSVDFKQFFSIYLFMHISPKLDNKKMVH